jgi:hypothetical protein
VLGCLEVEFHEGDWEAEMKGGEMDGDVKAEGGSVAAWDEVVAEVRWVVGEVLRWAIGRARPWCSGFGWRRRAGDVVVAVGLLGREGKGGRWCMARASVGFREKAEGREERVREEER